jgi:hypothetical protein
MSRINGDKARFNRERKQKIAKRKRNQQLLSAKQSASVQVAHPKS